MRLKSVSVRGGSETLPRRAISYAETVRHGTRRLERLFVVRLWREEGAPPDAIRGSAREVEGDQRFAFSDLGELEDFLRWRLAQAKSQLAMRRRVRARRCREAD